MPNIGGLEPVAPCKGNGISAQGKVNEVNDTLGSTHVPGLKTIAPCKGNTSATGATPRRQTSANQTTNVRKPNANRPTNVRKPNDKRPQTERQTIRNCKTPPNLQSQN